MRSITIIAIALLYPALCLAEMPTGAVSRGLILPSRPGSFLPSAAGVIVRDALGGFFALAVLVETADYSIRGWTGQDVINVCVALSVAYLFLRPRVSFGKLIRHIAGCYFLLGAVIHVIQGTTHAAFRWYNLGIACLQLLIAFLCFMPRLRPLWAKIELHGGEVKESP